MLVAALGVGRWADLARRMGEERTGKQCRERWHNHLSPVVDKQDWTEDEDRIISGGVARLGSKCVTCPHPLHLPISPSYPRPTQLYPTSLNDAAPPLRLRRVGNRQAAARQDGQCHQEPLELDAPQARARRGA